MGGVTIEYRTILAINVQYDEIPLTDDTPGRAIDVGCAYGG